jgi:hypothetical protein
MLRQELLGLLTRPLCFFERAPYRLLTLFQSGQDRSPCHFTQDNQQNDKRNDGPNYQARSDI